MENHRIIDVPVPPETLPTVVPHDLVDAWNAATLAASQGIPQDPLDGRGVRFQRPNGEELRVVFADIDVACWVGAVDRIMGLSNLHGLSVCFRLLGLIDQMATQAWTREHFSVGGGDGPDISPALLRTAAALPLSADARFDAIAFRQAAEALMGPRRLN